MCGIWAIFGSDDEIIHHCVKAYSKIQHRGPDAWRIENDRRFQNCSLGFHRLAIVDEFHGMQPMHLHCYPHLWLLCNGEIYNFKRLQEQFDFKFETICDVEIILHLYEQQGGLMAASHLDGVFAFCIVDVKKRRVVAARDTFGVRPAFRLTSDKGVLGFCSEAKGLIGIGQGFVEGTWKIDALPPGCVEEYELLETGKTKLIQSVPFQRVGDVPKYKMYISPESLSKTDIKANLRTLLEGAVRKRLMAHRRIGCLLSGGLDSSLIASLLVRLSKEEGKTYPIQSFAIGMGESPDIVAARRVAKYLGTEHHEVSFSSDDVARALEDIIYCLETYDITTIRASVGMYLLSKYIVSHTDSTVILSGEGADELLQGYIYFRDAPSAKEGDEESRRILNDLYYFDVLRADRTTSAYSLELRVPFLDHQFTSYVLSLPGDLRQPKDGVEKHLLRSAFAGTGALPDDILWRHKEAFSDGVASQKRSLFQVIQDSIESQISDEELANAPKDYPHCTPSTKESLYYRKVFEKHYPGQSHLTPYYWMPRWTDAKDPSARFIKHYAAKEEV